MNNKMLKNKSTPLVSILIVNYNYARFIGEAIESALNQDYENYEIIICDDGSKDESTEIISRYASEHPNKIRYIFKENGGQGSALNKAYEQSKGDIIAILDADDIFTTNKLRRVVQQFLAHPEVGLIINKLIKVDTNNRVIGSVPQFGKLDNGDLREQILNSGGYWSSAPASGLTFKREYADLVFPIPENLFMREADAYLFTQIPLFCQVYSIEEPLGYYRVHLNNLTATNKVDIPWCERVISSLERKCIALKNTAQKYGWTEPKIEYNPLYWEMVTIRDYLEGQNEVSNRIQNLKKLLHTIKMCQTVNRNKTFIKFLVIGLAVLLPKVLGLRIIERVYLPNNLKQRVSKLVK
ncbi:glycosyltransferase [Geobacillus thermoleovorans]|uniref:glycosyltransferase n=1 Tax=Geobacillus thermoleovorans TaxID=33941 RepID=UPI003DA4AD44